MRIITQCLDLIFPPRPDELILRRATKLPYQPDQWQAVIHLHDFRQPLVKAAITENKYQNSQRARKLLARSLARWCKSQTEPVIFIPVPLSTQREKERGHNQVTTILQAIAKPKFTILNNAVTRNKHTQPQTTLNKSERVQNLQGAFIVAKPEKITSLRETTIVILDDVVTTGATLQACAKPIKEKLDSSNKLILLALAH